MIEKFLYPSVETWHLLCLRPQTSDVNLNAIVAEIFSEVKANGDKAVHHYNDRFGVRTNELKVSGEELNAAESLLSAELIDAIQIAYKNIYSFHVSQLEEEAAVETMPGITCYRKSVPIDKVGLYIPGGTAPLLSTVLMLGIPAKIAGCNEIQLCSPAGTSGQIDPAILYAAKLCGITNVYKVGGIQAIAALCYGTESITKVYKIFGPGNQYVTAAKQKAVDHGVAIDMPAGPSEVLIIIDETAEADFVAADLLAQAEHGADSQVILVSTSIEMVNDVLLAIDEQLENLPRKEIAKRALQNSKAIIVKDVNEAIAFSNFYAPEHLIIMTKSDFELSEKVANAGSVFLGKFSPESVGDYASGTNHTLPTAGFARNYSGVSVDSFVKKITFQFLTEEGLNNIAKTVEILAAAEGLEGHKNAVSIRIQKLDSQR